MPISTKFALYDFAGKARAHYLVDEIEVPKPVLEPTVSHHIVVVDRSGSMYGVMDSTKAMVEKVMTVEEFQSSGLLLTLISYSSKGDFTVHFARTPVSEVLDPANPHVKAMRNIRATCLTSVSGALTEALNHIVDTETTAVSIHTDGYFNDSSPAAEAKAVDAWIKKVAVKPNVFVNTISYGNWTDFKILDRIASSLSGKCIVAKDVKQVYTALHDTSAVLAGRVLPAINVKAEEDAFLAFHNVTQKKVNGSATDFAVKGVGPDDETRLFRFKKVVESTWNRSKSSEASGADLLPVYVFARTLLGQQRLNDAKFALMATRDEALIQRHYKALTAEALSALAEDLEARIGGANEDYKDIGAYGFGANKTSVLELCALLEKHKRDFTLDLDQTLMGYSRRGVKRLAGKWNDDGTFAPASTRLVPTDDSARVSVLDMPGAPAFELSNTASTINMFVERRGDLYKAGEKVTTVAGRKVSPTQIRAYTLVGDGEINAERLYLNISGKRLYAALVDKGLLPADETFDHAKTYMIDLTQMPACSFSDTVAMPAEDTFNRLVELSIKRGVLLASLGGSAKADEWTAEQLAELKAHDLTAALWYSPPTTNPYTDLNAAVSEGEIDTRTSFNVTLGDARMVSSKALYSANEYLARRFSVKVEGADAADCDKEGFLKKPKFTDLRGTKATVALKTLSARTKLNAIDEAMFPFFEAFLLKSGFEGVHVASSDEEKATLLADVEAFIEALYAERIRPLAFYIGATGLVPEGWTVEVLDAEALEARFPGIDIEKKQTDGTFLVSGDTVIGVFPEVAYFSTMRGVERARDLSIEEAA
jgi:hypothetical protein